MKRIPLTQGKFAIVDDDDFDKLSQFKWYAKSCTPTGVYYAMRRDPKPAPRGKVILMHRYIMAATGVLYVDHINHDTLDNRKSNLRLCTNSQNCANRLLHPVTTSGFKGVVPSSKPNRWHARVMENRKRRHVGTYDTPEDAAAAYDCEMVKIHGEFAMTNRKLGLI